MKRVLIVLFAVLISSNLQAGVTNRHIKAGQLRMLGKSAGFFILPATGNVIRVVNASQSNAAIAMRLCAGSIEKELRVKVELSELKGNVDNSALVRSVMAMPNTGCAVMIVNKGKEAPAILAAPEDGWTLVNVDRLTIDGTTDDILQARLYKEIWRASAYALGAGDTISMPCLLESVHNLQDLDKQRIMTPCPEVIMKMENAITRRKILPLRKVSYRKACEEGWAPAPTNEAQKIIWDMVHEIPSTPMKIEFDPKKGR